MKPESPDPLDQEIAAAKRAVAEAERALEVATAVLSALQRVASMRPRVTISDVSSVQIRPSSGRGKAPGTIGNQWRTIMGRIVADGNNATHPENWARIATASGYSLEPKAVRDWLRRAADSEHGYIERQDDNYRVSDAAIKKFHLNATEPSPEVTGNGSE